MTNNEIIKGLKIIELTSETEQEKICVQAAISALERHTGEWIHIINDKWKCSRCENIILTEGSWEKPEDNFCKECGADMREENK